MLLKEYIDIQEDPIQIIKEKENKILIGDERKQYKAEKINTNVQMQLYLLQGLNRLTGCPCPFSTGTPWERFVKESPLMAFIINSEGIFPLRFQLELDILNILQTDCLNDTFQDEQEQNK